MTEGVVVHVQYVKTMNQDDKNTRCGNLRQVAAECGLNSNPIRIRIQYESVYEYESI